MLPVPEKYNEKQKMISMSQATPIWLGLSLITFFTYTSPILVENKWSSSVDFTEENVDEKTCFFLIGWIRFTKNILYLSALI